MQSSSMPPMAPSTSAPRVASKRPRLEWSAVATIGGALLALGSLLVPWYTTVNPAQTYFGWTLLAGDQVTYSAGSLTGIGKGFLGIGAGSSTTVTWNAGSLSGFDSSLGIMAGVCVVVLLLTVAARFFPWRMWQRVGATMVGVVGGVVGLHYALAVGVLLGSLNMAPCSSLRSISNCDPIGSSGPGTAIAALGMLVVVMGGIGYARHLRPRASTVGMLGSLLAMASLLAPWYLTISPPQAYFGWSLLVGEPIRYSGGGSSGDQYVIIPLLGLCLVTLLVNVWARIPGPGRGRRILWATIGIVGGLLGLVGFALEEIALALNGFNPFGGGGAYVGGTGPGPLLFATGMGAVLVAGVVMMRADSPAHSLVSRAHAEV